MDRDEAEVKLPVERQRRRHSAAFKQQIIAACQRPGLSLSAVALANQLNANQVRAWVKADRERRGELAASPKRTSPPTPTWVPVTVQDTGIHVIRIVLRQTTRELQIDWPAHDAATCAEWLSEVLR